MYINPVAPLKNSPLETVKFTGALTFDENGTLISQRKPGEKIWFGEPTPQMDALWESIAKGEFLCATRCPKGRLECLADHAAHDDSRGRYASGVGRRSDS